MNRTSPAVPRSPTRRARGALVFLSLLGVAACGAGGGGGSPGGGNPPPVIAPGEGAVTDLAVEPGGTPGTVRLRFTAPAGPAGARPEGYRVRVAVVPPEPGLLPSEGPLPTTFSASAPGTPESILLTGLENGRTPSVLVTALFSGLEGPAGPAASCRVPGAVSPSPPAGALTLTGPATLDQEGRTYVLTRDVATAGTAFTITARDVTLDLGGRTVTYGTGPGDGHHGVFSQWLYASGRTTVRNGRLVQGNGGGAGGDAVAFLGAHDVRLSDLDLDVHGPDASGVAIVQDPTGSVRVDHCRIACRTTVVSNRHYPGVAAVVVEGAAGPVELDQNLVTASPQWGLKVMKGTGPVRIHHNRVVGTKALVANGYMVGAYAPQAEVFDNDLDGESRGIHVDGRDGTATQARVHGNRVRAKDQPNAEFPEHWSHGLKLEGPAQALVHHNDVEAAADDLHSEARALDLDLGGAPGVVVRDNRFAGLSSSTRFLGVALEYTAGPDGPYPAEALRRNVLVATDVAIRRAWDAGRGVPMGEGWWVRDFTLGPGRPFVFERFDVSDLAPSAGHRLRDVVGDVDDLLVTQWPGTLDYDSTREVTLTVLASEADGAPVPGALVVVRDRLGAEVLRRTTDAAGRASGVVVADRVTEGPVLRTSRPFSVAVTEGGRTATLASLDPTGPAAVLADLGAGTAVADLSAPAEPTDVAGHVLSASRVLLSWTASEDRAGVVAYRVYLDGRAFALTDRPYALLAGLAAGRRHVPSVAAVDAGGNVSAAAAGAAFTTAVEDRGP